MRLPSSRGRGFAGFSHRNSQAGVGNSQIKTEMPEDSVFRFLPQIERVFAGSTVEDILKALDAELAAARQLEAEGDELAGFLEGLKQSMASACPLMLKVRERSPADSPHSSVAVHGLHLPAHAQGAGAQSGRDSPEQ
eukprot:980296-Prorocentrum_minimum.AAC.1